MAGSSHILCTSDGPVATITLNRPERRNALSRQLIEELSATVDAIGRDESARVVILAASGVAFCAGHDLVEMRGRDEAFFEGLYAACTTMMMKLHLLPQPVIARVQGVAAAGGCHLVAACDLVVASRTARFAVPGPRVGLPGTTAMVEVARATGVKRAMQLLLTGELIAADEAAGWGFVNYVVEADELDDFSLDLARRIAAFSRPVIADAKRAVYDSIGPSRSDAYDAARQAMARSSAAPDAQEGIAAFLDGRPPHWPSDDAPRSAAD